MKIEHIIWKYPEYNQEFQYGILDLEVYYYGDNEPRNIIIEGSYNIYTNEFKSSLVQLNNKEYISHLRLKRIGEFSE
jgi:hypothetical protein